MSRQRVQLEFEKYVSHYDTAYPKIRFKIEHTYKVADLCERIARSLSMSEEEITAAWICGMLHDIGRFEQVHRFHTFIDAESVDHAKFGAELLFAGSWIKQTGMSGFEMPYTGTAHTGCLTA